MRSLTYRLSAVLLVLVTAPPLALLAQGWIEPMHPLPGGGIVRVRSAVAAAVTGRVARVTVEEWFQNRGPGLGEGTYLYPLPGEAVFSSFSLWQGDQELRGETMDAGQARAIYEDIVRRKRDPALIELAGHGLVRARVFPINPGETRKITLRYTQVLDRVGDAWRLRYAAGPDAAPRSIRVVVDSGARFGEPYSPTHQVRTTRRNDQLEITLADSSVRGGGGGGGGGRPRGVPAARARTRGDVPPHAPPSGRRRLLHAPARAGYRPRCGGCAPRRRRRARHIGFNVWREDRASEGCPRAAAWHAARW